MELTGLIERLKLDHLGLQLDSLCEQAAGRELDYRSFLTEALHLEWRGRQGKGIEAKSSGPGRRCNNEMLPERDATGERSVSLAKMVLDYFVVQHTSCGTC